MEQFTAQFSWMISPSVMLAPYGLLTGVCYRSATDHVTRKWTEEWCQYYPVECGGNNSPQTATGAGKEKRSPGGGLADLEAASETEDLVQVIVSNVPMRYPTCYILVCDADSAVNSGAFNQLVISKGLHCFNGFGRSSDAPLSRPAQRPSHG